MKNIKVVIDATEPSSDDFADAKKAGISLAFHDIGSCYSAIITGPEAAVKKFIEERWATEDAMSFDEIVNECGADVSEA